MYLLMLLFQEPTEIHDSTTIEESSSSKSKSKHSEPIPIGYVILSVQILFTFKFRSKKYSRNSHTVSGHEAAHLAKRLTAELAQQQGRGLYSNSRPNSPEAEPRARSYDQNRQDSPQNNGIFFKINLLLYF